MIKQLAQNRIDNHGKDKGNHRGNKEVQIQADLAADAAQYPGNDRDGVYVDFHLAVLYEVAPVSYTHLDVYKRQTETRTRPSEIPAAASSSAV